MVAVLFLLEVVLPVLVEVSVGVEGAELEDGLGGGCSPAGAGDVHAVLDEVAAGALDDAGEDGPAFGEGGGVVEVGGLGVEVAGHGGGGLGLGGLSRTPALGGADGARGVAGVAVQDRGGVRADPGAGVRLASGWKHQAASHRCSMTCMKSTVMVTVTFRTWQRGLRVGLASYRVWNDGDGRRPGPSGVS